MKPINDSRLINRLIVDELIQDLFSYLFYLHSISQICQLPSSDLLICIELAESLNTLYESAPESQSGETKTMQFHLLPLLLCSNEKLNLKFAPERLSLAMSNQPCLLLPPQLSVSQQIPCSIPARLYTGIRLHSIAIYHYNLDGCLIFKQPRTWW